MQNFKGSYQGWKEIPQSDDNKMEDSIDSILHLENVMQNHNPFDIFMMFFDDEVLMGIIRNTNESYSTSSTKRIQKEVIYKELQVWEFETHGMWTSVWLVLLCHEIDSSNSIGT